MVNKAELALIPTDAHVRSQYVSTSKLGNSLSLNKNDMAVIVKDTLVMMETMVMQREWTRSQVEKVRKIRYWI